jgi:hypothetical protein
MDRERSHSVTCRRRVERCDPLAPGGQGITTAAFLCQYPKLVLLDVENAVGVRDMIANAQQGRRG